MAEVEKVMTISAGDIEKIMNIATDDIEKLNTFDWPASGVAWAGTRGIQFGGRVNDSVSNQIGYRTIQSSSDTQDFGNLVVARERGGGASSNITRGIMGDGSPGTGPYSIGVMDYVTIGTTDDAGDFGDITGESVGSDAAHMSNGTLAFIGGGFKLADTYWAKDMSYVTIASTGDSTGAGDIFEATNFCGSTSGDSRGLIWTGYDSTTQGITTIQYITFHTSNNGADFGDATGSMTGAAFGSQTRSVHGHGKFVSGSTTNLNEIEFVTVASTSGAGTFGDQHVSVTNFCGLSDGTRGEWWYGDASIGYVTIASEGNATEGSEVVAAATGTTEFNNSGTSGT